MDNSARVAYLVAGGRRTTQRRRSVVVVVFDEMPQRDVVSWNSIVNGYVKMGELVVARELFDAMPYRNLVGWNVMMNGYLN
ncbi:hypothetical protein RND71_022326 [Anisodus tanguticus]|uniref:Pentatricopeptide repeat-containing protein n=1 Tax=Anisodus tanguticus TaxID=243964 RepID=A0AAE1V934_9SOLA|nr:hypothetical protein RND71_022326 [Anisodus tanguticus]